MNVAMASLFLIRRLLLAGPCPPVFSPIDLGFIAAVQSEHRPISSDANFRKRTRNPRVSRFPPCPVPHHALPPCLRHLAAAALLAISFRSFAVSAFVSRSSPLGSNWPAISFQVVVLG